MSTKKWRLSLTALNGTSPPRELDVEAANWMGALRECRKLLGEEGGLPSGASCAVSPDGSVTILDSGARRKFLLTPQASGDAAPSPVTAPAASAAAAPAASAEVEAPKKKKKFETVAFSAIEAQAMLQGKAPIAVGTPATAAAPADAPAPPVSPETAATAGHDGLELLMQRDEQPTKQNPLTYRERAYLVPQTMRVSDAEAALRFVLADLRAQLQDVARGKLVALAAFDHRWTDTPERPPLVVLQWRDWRSETLVDYPAAVRTPSLAPADPHDTDERMSVMFEALQDLAHKQSALEGLELVLSALQQTIAAAAMSGVLYDINTDQLRFVSLTGPGARERQGQAIGRNVGLLGQAARVEQAVIVPDLRVQPMYSPDTDGRAGLQAGNMLLRSAMHDGQLLAILQLIDRQHGAFTAGDVHVINYAAERLGDFLYSVRARPVR